MIAKLVALAVALMLLGAAVAVAAPPARDNLDDGVALTETRVPLYIPRTVLPATLDETRALAGPPAKDNLDNRSALSQTLVPLYIPRVVWPATLGETRAVAGPPARDNL